MSFSKRQFLAHVDASASRLIVNHATLPAHPAAVRSRAVPDKKLVTGTQGAGIPLVIESISRADTMLHLRITREQIKGSPEFHPLTPIHRGYEERLYGFHGVARYWV